jgi:hypothetical protein
MVNASAGGKMDSGFRRNDDIDIVVHYRALPASATSEKLDISCYNSYMNGVS